MKPTTQDFTTAIHRHNFRVTPQRQIILNAIAEGNGHTTLDEIAARVHRDSPAISLPTIYRTLDFLCELKLVVALRIGSSMFYEIAGEQPHHHLVCRVCGTVEYLGNDEVKSLFETVEKRYQFAVDMDHLGLFGLCSECKQNPISQNL